MAASVSRLGPLARRHLLLGDTTLRTAPQLSHARWASNLSRRRTRRSNEFLLVPKVRAEAISGEFPSTPVGPATGFGGFGGGGGGGGGGGMKDAVLTTVVGVFILFTGGIAYMSWYKHNVLAKIEKAFAPGYDPALELTKGSPRQSGTDADAKGLISEQAPVRRTEQDLVDRIVHGEESGHYFVLLGPKGTGKTTMILEAMQKIQAEGFAMCDAHPDLEVFRLRLGKALDYEFNEDTQTGLFQRRDPREAGPALDVERALNKLEKVALKYAQKHSRPLVLVFNNVHYFKHDDDGQNMLLQLQQRAEAWAASGILTMVFSTDDAWPFLVMRKSASRMHVVSVSDLSNTDACRASKRMRFLSRHNIESEEVYEKVVNVLGGRLTYLSRAAKAQDMVKEAEAMLAIEKAWLQSQVGLIPDCDDDVMDEQKWSSCSWLLLREFVKKRQEDEAERKELIESGEATEESLGNLGLPKIPYYQCRQIMTRPDFLDELDRLNIIAIDINHDVTPDSLMLLHAAEEVVAEEGFDELLDGVRARVDEIESLHRTRELTFKDVDAGDRIRLTVDKGGARLVED